MKKALLPVILAGLVELTSARLGTSLWQARLRAIAARGRVEVTSSSRPDLTKLYPEYNLSVPIDHFHNDSLYEPHSDDSFNLRYWFDASHYKEGGPVFVFESGEDDAQPRLPILNKGIIYQLAKATNGIGVILEHRYYGSSQPFRDLSTKHLRFLTTDQALADTAYFAQNIVFKGLEEKNLTSHTTPWIAYGGSYSGAFVAFLRKLYPETFFGAISSSGVTEAIVDYWRYYEPIRKHGPEQCILNTQLLTNAMDNIFLKDKNKHLRPTLKTVFELPQIPSDHDFMQFVSENSIGQWQSMNWDPEVDSPRLSWYCGNVSSEHLLYPSLRNRERTVKQLLEAGGYAVGAKALAVPMLNWIGYLNNSLHLDNNLAEMVAQLQRDGEVHSSEDDDLMSTWRCWTYQVCTQWGYFMTGSVPEGQLPLISRLADLESERKICREFFNITSLPDVNAINKYGGYNLSYPRLAIVDGQWDPWIEATPHSSLAPKRKSTPSEPFYEIERSVHHWDENGLFANESSSDLPPGRVLKIQELEVEWVMGWLAEANQHTELK